MDLSGKLLALAASVSWDGGAGVLRTLRQILREDAPFDAAEVALSRSPGFQRWTLTDEDEPVADEDLLERAAAAQAPIRIDDVSEIDFVPRTRALLEGRGLRSCLALPLCGAGGPEGAIVLAREHGWAFAGVSLHTLWPVASMAGLCLARAVALTALKRELETSRVGSLAQEEGLRKSLAAVESEAHGLRQEVEALRREGEERRGEAERLAGEVRQAQGLAESRTAELASAIQRLADLDRRLAERESELVLAPPPAVKRRRRSQSAGLPGGAADPSLGEDPGTS